MPDFDVVVWGASGFTGRLVAEYLHQRYSRSELKWAIAGRNEAKLKQVREDIAGSDAGQIPIVIADSNNEASLTELAGKTRVICTTVGPYARYGSALVKVCAESGTHYCDLTGEVQWMRKMIDQHMTVAENSGARIVHTCGFDSIPSDLGVHYLQQALFEKTGKYATRIKCRIVDSRGGVSGGTIDSMMAMMEEARVDPSILDLLEEPYALNPLNMPAGKDVNEISGVSYDTDFRQWLAPFVMAAINTRVVRRSHALLGYPYGEGFRYDESMLMGDGFGGRARASMVANASRLVMMAAAFEPTRSILKKIAPSPGEGPSEETIEKGFFDIQLYGWHEDGDIRVQVKGKGDPGYGATSKMIGESAVCLAMDNLDSPTGVSTPAVAMGDRLISRLIDKAGMSFSVLPDDRSQSG